MRASLVLGMTTVLAGLLPACGSTESTCEERGDCVNPCGDPSYAAAHPDVCPDAGAGGTGGTAGAGAGGTSGSGGTAGTAGTGGAGGEGGSGGIDAGDAGDAEAGGGSDGGDAEAEPYCDPTLMPGEDACVIDDLHGVFVSPSGTDGAACGTQAAPCATLGQGMIRAKAEGKRVYACGDGGAYDESLRIDGSLDGLLMFGGFRCSDWSYEPSLVRARVEPGTGTALEVENLATGLEMRDFALRSADATAAGESSIASFVRDSAGVVFDNCVFEAGNGAAGSDGTAGTAGETVPSVGADQQGENADCSTTDPIGGGLWATGFTCAAGGTTRGGKGGTAVYEDDGLSGDDGDPDTNLQSSTMGLGGPGGTFASKGGEDGGDGSDGNAGDHGAVAAPSGTMGATGFTPADGQDGSNGYPGQGGGGGGASWSKTGCVGPSGGAGGLGGCGGFGGTKGMGGGASIAMVAWSSSVTLRDCSLVSADGGKGGDGGDGGGGSAGEAGHIGGAGISLPMVEAGKGGTGGDGGLGGSGSGGTGGPSVALAYHGSAPVQEGSTSLTPGSGGPKGIGGQAPGGDQAPDGSGGSSAAVVEVL